MVGMIKRFVGFNSPIDVKRQLYLAHVRSILEYCSPMWSPTHVKDIIKLERVQRQASKFILNDYVSPYHKRCTTFYSNYLCARLFSSNVLIFIALLAYGTLYLLLSDMLVACRFLRRT